MTLSNKELEKRINTLDLSLFSQIESQSNDAEKKSFLLLQKIIRNTIASYTYLEIGSHLGGSLQSYFIDPKCRRIFSIDKRPTSQPDIRGKHYFYENNSTQRMLANLKQAFPDGNLDKLTTIDKSTNEIDTNFLPI